LSAKYGILSGRSILSQMLKLLLAHGADPYIEGRNGTAADLIDFEANPELKSIFRIPYIPFLRSH
jgi:hypothetical protein